MKKQLKRIGALALALVFALCLMLPAFADGEGTTSEVTKNPKQETSENSGDGSITINSAQKDKTYDIYRILDLTLSEKSKDESTGKVTYNYAYKMNSEWKDFFFPTGEDPKYITTEQPTGDNIVPLTYEDKQYYIVISDPATFAQDALEYATSLTTNDGTQTATADGDLTFSNIALGYYLVYPQGAAVNRSGSICSLTSTDKNVTVNIKAKYPTIEKTSEQENAVVGIGETVSFKIEGEVPDTTGYVKGSYIYTIKDTMSEGLSFNDDIKVTIGGKETTTGYTLVTQEKNKDLDSTFALTINNVDELTAGDAIIVTYTAMVTAKAAATNIQNKAHLVYSNDPNTDGTGTVDSTDDEVKFYTANIEAYAYAGKDDAFNADNKNPATALNGATYVLKNKTTGEYYSWDGNKVVWVSDEQSATHLKTDDTGVANTVVTVKKENENDGTQTAAAADTTPIESFKGLGAGEYTLVETDTPAGYNQATSVDFKVSANTNQTATDKVVTSDVAGVYIDDDYTYRYAFNHKTGTVLPSTGGMGTKLFYIIGAALVIGAGVLLVVRRRMGEEE
jgi:fimbrial isopeptide formation D2 family protein/LPXTG-motif cell wall-anchored protein